MGLNASMPSDPASAVTGPDGNGRSHLDYDTAAEFYDSTRGASPSLLAAIVELLGPAEGRTLLEVGCGTGNYAQAFAEAGFRVYGLDICREMLERAQEKIGGVVAIADAQRLPLPDRSVDCVVTINVYHHLPDPVAAFREFARVARSATVHHLTAIEQLHSHWALHYLPSHQIARPGEHVTREELRAQLSLAGFRGVRTVRFDYADCADASFMALRHAPAEALLESRQRHGVSCMRRLTPTDEARSARALTADIASGRIEEVRREYDARWEAVGDSTLLFGRARETA